MEELNKAPLGGYDQIVEVYENFIGGKKSRKGVKGRERRQNLQCSVLSNWWSVFTSKPSTTPKARAIRPVLEANLSRRYMTEVVTFYDPVAYSVIIPKDKHTKANPQARSCEMFGDTIGTRTIEGRVLAYSNAV